VLHYERMLDAFELREEEELVHHINNPRMI
jgi:hypothetical protein